MFGFANMKEWIRYFLYSKSSRGFGVHSPFIFRFQTLVANPKRRDGKLRTEFLHIGNKQERLILRMLSYYDIQTVLVSKNQPLKELICRYFPQVEIVDSKPERADLVICNALDNTEETLPELKCDSKKEKWLVLMNKHEKGQDLWKKVKTSTINLDLYVMGISIFDSRKQKESFRLFF